MNILSNFFAHPWFLAGLVGAALPILIEWLFRRRRRRVLLPTIRFLLKPEDEQKIRRQDRLLLILRCVICALVALAVSRPVLRAEHVRFTALPHVVVVIDNTASMNQSVGVTTAFSEAKKKAAEMLRQLPSGSAVSVLALSEQTDVIVENSKECLAAAVKLEALSAGEGAASIRDGLAKAKDVLERSGSARGEIYILSDFQKYTWLRNSEEISQAAQLVSDLGTHHTLYFVDCAGEVEYNDAVMRLAPVDPILSAHLPMKFVADIRRYGKAPADTKANVIFLVDGVKKSSQEYPGTASLEFTYRFPDPGEHLVAVEIENDRYKLDNQRFYLASVPETHQVLILDPTASRPGLARGSFFLDRAISPPVAAGFDRVSQFTTKVVDPASAIYENFDDYAVVALLNCETIDEALAAKLQTRVRTGGTALLFLGPGVNPYEYNRRLFRDGMGVLPGQIAAPVMEARDMSLQAFPGLARPGLKPSAFAAKVTAFVPFAATNATTAVSATTLGSLATPGSAMAAGRTSAILERNIGRGRAIVVCLPPDLTWSTIPASAEFALMTQDILRELLGQLDAGVNLQVGETFEQPVMVSAQPLLIQSPGGRNERLVPEETRDGWRVRYTGTHRHGVYEVKTAPEILRRRRFVVNVQTQESDLTKATPDDLRGAWGGNWTYISARESWSDSVGKRYAMTELAPAVLWILAAILATEAFLASRFGRRRDSSSNVRRGGRS